MRPGPLLAALLLLAPLAGVAAAPAARADERPGAGDRDWVARLTPGERALLERKIPAWGEFDARKRQRIAHNVIRMRDPAQREKVLERIRDLEAHRERGHGRMDHRRMLMPFAAAIGERVAAGLPETFRETLATKRIPRALASMALFHKVFTAAAQVEVGQFTPEDVDAFPKAWRDRARRLAAVAADPTAGEEARREARGHLGGLRVWTLAEGLRRRLTEEAAGEAGDGRVEPEAFAAALERRWPAAFEQVRTEVARDAAFLLERLARHARPGDPRPGDPRRGRGRLGREDLGRLLFNLERLAYETYRDRPEQQARVAATVADLLVTAFGATEDEAAALPPHARRADRTRALRALVGREGR